MAMMRPTKNSPTPPGVPPAPRFARAIWRFWMSASIGSRTGVSAMNSLYGRSARALQPGRGSTHGLGLGLPPRDVRPRAHRVLRNALDRLDLGDAVDGPHARRVEHDLRDLFVGDIVDT